MPHTGPGGSTIPGQGCSGPSGTEPLPKLSGIPPHRPGSLPLQREGTRVAGGSCPARAGPTDRRGSGSQNQARGFANIPFQSAAKRDYTELSSTRNILLPFTFQINYFSNNPLTALAISVTYSPVLRESYLFENSLRFSVALHITCTIRRKQEGFQTGKRRVSPSFHKTSTPLRILVLFLIQRKWFSPLLSTHYSRGSPWKVLGAEASGENGPPSEKGLTTDLNSLT